MSATPSSPDGSTKQASHWIRRGAPEFPPGPLVVRMTRCRLGEHRKQVARRDDQVVLAGVLDFGSAVLAVDDLVTHRNVERNTVAVVVHSARSYRHDLALLGLLLDGVRDDEAGGRRLLGCGRLHDDLVFQGLD